MKEILRKLAKRQISVEEAERLLKILSIQKYYVILL